MRELPVIEDKRLLRALDYIDERFIAEVTEEYEIFDPRPGAKLPPRARMYRFRQFAALAACLVLFSVLAAIVPNVANSAIQFLAGAFAGNPYKDYDPHDSPVFDYPLSMSVDEIYADVMLGDWVVSNDHICESNSQLVEEFHLKVKDRKPASLLLAQYISADAEEELSYVQEKYEIEKDGSPSIELLEVVYDGEKFIHIFRFIHSATQYECEEIEEYKYLKKTDSRSNTVYYLTDDKNLEYGSSWYTSSAPAPRRTIIFILRNENDSTEKLISDFDPNYVLTEEDYTNFEIAHKKMFKQDIHFERYHIYGKCGNCLVYWTDSMVCAVQEIIVEDYLFTTNSGQRIWVLYNQKIYSLNEAYDEGIVTYGDIVEINKIHVQIPAFGGGQIGVDCTVNPIID